MIQLAFVCTQNAARSQMAEAIGRHLAETRYPGLRVCSAGARPSGKVNPNAIRVIEELGISMESHWSKSLDEIDSDALDYVITLCDDAAEHCPVIPGATRFVLVGSQDGSAYAIDAINGAELWSEPLGDIVQAAPVKLIRPL